MDILDWLAGLKRWWWLIVVPPMLAFLVAWLAMPAAPYDAHMQLQVTLGDPSMSNSPAYFDYILLDDMDQLVKSSVLGDLVYLALPENIKQTLTRSEMGEMVTSYRRGRFVEIHVRGENPEVVSGVIQTLQGQLPAAVNDYLIPLDYRDGPAVIHVMNPITAPERETRARLTRIGALTVAAGIVGVAATGVAEWMRLAGQRKYGSR